MGRDKAVSKTTEAVNSALTSLRLKAEIKNINASTALTNSKVGVIDPASKIGSTLGGAFSSAKSWLYNKKDFDLGMKYLGEQFSNSAQAIKALISAVGSANQQKPLNIDIHPNSGN